MSCTANFANVINHVWINTISILIVFNDLVTLTSYKVLDLKSPTTLPIYSYLCSTKMLTLWREENRRSLRKTLKAHKRSTIDTTLLT